MGMGIDVRELTGYGTKRDYSMLLNNLPSRSGAGAANLGFLADYASIKNGSYGKLMNAYYGTGRERVSQIANPSTLSTAKDSTKQLKEIEGAAETLKASADKLLVSGAGSVFAEKDVTTVDENGVSSTKSDYDREAIYKAISNFVDDYNNLLERAGGARASSISGKISSLANMTNANKNTLDRIGVTIGTDGKLSIDEEKFMASDMATAKSLFNGTGSYGFRVSAQASWIDFAATNEASKSNTYNAQGSFTNNFSTGDIFGSYF